MKKAFLGISLVAYMANANAFGPVSVPETSSWLLLLVGVIGLFVASWKK